MQAVLTQSVAVDVNKELEALFENLNGADNSLKSVIENDVVRFGNIAVEFLIEKLITSKGVQRGVAAMSLIRIGEGAVQSLRQLCENKSYAWIANYIIKEIEGTF